MDFEIRKFEEKDEQEILSMMEIFYSSPCVSTNGSKEIFENDFNACLNGEFAQGFVFVVNEKILGYSMLTKSFSTEFGKTCYWFEDFYLKPQYRGKHIIPKFVEYIKNLYPNAIFKLEAEKENTHALYVYKKCGFKELPYTEMML